MGTGSDPEGGPLGVHMRNQKLRNIGPSGAFWQEMMPPPGKYGSADVQPEITLGGTLGRPRLSFSSPGYLPLLFS